MKYEIRFKPAFSTLFVTLNPGERIIAEAGAMASRDAQLTMKTEFAGGLLTALFRRLFGGESLFVNVFINQTNQPLNVVLTQSVIGDLESIDVSQGEICVQPGAYIAHTSGVKIGVQWAGFASWLAGEGLFKLRFSGRGRLFIGAYGGLTKKRITGTFVVDTGHLVAYDPHITMKIGLASGLVGSLTSGEGLVNRLSGKGIIYLQSRSLDGLVRFLRPKVPN